MLKIKKEYLSPFVNPYKIPLSELHQNHLKDIQNKYGNKYFEIEKPKKKKKDDSIDSFK